MEHEIHSWVELLAWLMGENHAREELLKLFAEGYRAERTDTSGLSSTALLVAYVNARLVPVERMRQSPLYTNGVVRSAYLAGYAKGRLRAMHDMVAHPLAFLREATHPRAAGSVRHHFFYSNQFRRLWQWIAEGDPRMVNYPYALYSGHWVGYDMLLEMAFNRARQPILRVLREWDFNV